MRLERVLSGAALALMVGCGGMVLGQSSWQPGPTGIGFSAPQGAQWVRMVSSPELSVKAGAPQRDRQNLELRFRIQDGLHINSHTPHSRYLIPTTLTLDAPAGVRIVRIDYPQGVDYRFHFSPNEALSVYTGTFSVLVQVHAGAGRHTVHGRLHYQACDDRTCNPPKTLPLTLDVTAK